MSWRLPCTVADCPALQVPSDTVEITHCHCEAYVKARLALRNIFKYDHFQPGQLSALMPVLHGRDVLVKMATGAGKSLCFFLAPLSVSPHAVAIIISPLNGLMEQQVNYYCTIMCGSTHAYFILGEKTRRCWSNSSTCAREQGL